MPSLGTIALVILLAMFLCGTIVHGRDFFRGEREAFLGLVLAGSLSAITFTGLL